jgi:hypothetical protein
MAVDEMMIRLDGAEHWLCGAVDPETNEVIHLRLFRSTPERTSGGHSSSSTGNINSII